MSEFSIGTYLRKKSGAFWEGTVVGHYRTEQTPAGVAVQLFGWEDGPVQIYPAAALVLCDRSASRLPPSSAMKALVDELDAAMRGQPGSADWWTDCGKIKARILSAIERESGRSPPPSSHVVDTSDVIQGQPVPVQTDRCGLHPVFVLDDDLATRISTTAQEEDGSGERGGATRRREIPFGNVVFSDHALKTVQDLDVEPCHRPPLPQSTSSLHGECSGGMATKAYTAPHETTGPDADLYAQAPPSSHVLGALSRGDPSRDSTFVILEKDTREGASNFRPIVALVPIGDQGLQLRGDFEPVDVDLSGLSRRIGLEAGNLDYCLGVRRGEAIGLVRDVHFRSVSSEDAE